MKQSLEQTISSDSNSTQVAESSVDDSDWVQQAPSGVHSNNLYCSGMTCILSVEGSMPESPRSTEHECSFDEPVKSDQIETPDEAQFPLFFFTIFKA